MKQPTPLGVRFGRLVVSAEAPSRTNSNGITHRYALCRCDCGTLKEIRFNSLKNGTTQSCGCLHREKLSSRNYKHGYGAFAKRTPEYRTWLAMKDRCQNPKNILYHRYGGRGVKVCERWLESFENFLEDMGTRPPEFSIDRIDNDGNYEPGNCCWASRETQDRNKSSTHVVKYEGKDYAVATLERHLGLRPNSIYHNYISKKWSLEKAIQHARESKLFIRE